MIIFLGCVKGGAGNADAFRPVTASNWGFIPVLIKSSSLFSSPTGDDNQLKRLLGNEILQFQKFPVNYETIFWEI